MIKWKFLKCPSEGDKNVEYFTSLMAKSVNTKYRYLYNQPPSPSNPFDTFCLSNKYAPYVWVKPIELNQFIGGFNLWKS